MFQEVTFRARKMKKPTLKKLPKFQEMKLLNPKLKKILFSEENPLGFFITVSSDVFISPLIFTIVFGCFHCWLHWFASSLFLQVFLFHYWFYYCFFECYDFTNVLYVAVFCHVLCFCVVVPWVLRISESFFYSQAFFTLHSFPTFGTIPSFIKGSMGPAVPPWGWL